MCKGRCRRSPEGTADPIEAGNLLTWVWGVELRSSGRAAPGLKYCANSSALL